MYEQSTLPIVSRIIFVLIAIGVLVGIVYKNIEPAGVTMLYSIGESDSDDITPLNPSNRVETIVDSGKNIAKQIGDIIYFSTRHVSRIEKAVVKLRFKNPFPDQDVFIGYQDSDRWHFDRRLIDAPLLNTLNWSSTGDDPVLLQRVSNYRSVDDFLSHPPADSFIGVYQYEKDILLSRTKLPGYTPSEKQTEITMPLRGRHTMYVYANNERFIMSIAKQDLNWYEGEDVTTVRIFKEGDLVYEMVLDDDGITEANRQVVPPMEGKMANPGPELPEPGVYKVVIDAPADSVITSIKTNLHKIVFEGSMFFAGHPDVYKGIEISSTSASLYSDALALTARTYHPEGRQSIQVGDEQMKIQAEQTDVFLIPKNPVNDIRIPQGDVILTAVNGYFSLNKDMYFRPTAYNFISIKTKDDLDLVDYILTSYTPSKSDGSDGWRTNEVAFDLTDAYPKNGRLSWVLIAPGLQQNMRYLFIDRLSAELKKKPLNWKFWERE